MGVLEEIQALRKRKTLKDVLPQRKPPSYPLGISPMTSFVQAILPDLQRYDDSLYEAGGIITDKLAQSGNPILEKLAPFAGTAAYTAANMFDPIPNMGMPPVYHGSPHKWMPEPGFPKGRPRLDKIGTGEGAQAYGWGWYSAERPGTAEAYRRALGGKDFGDFDEVAEEASWWADAVGKTREQGMADLEKALNDNPQRIWGKADIERKKKALEYLKSGGETKKPEYTGLTYSLDLPDTETEKFLDWDAPLSEQSEYVKAILDKTFGIRKGGSEAWKQTGGEFYRDLVIEEFGDNPQLTSESLKSAGIPGNKYWDGGSRSAGEGTRNFVIWDQDLLDRLQHIEN